MNEQSRHSILSLPFTNNELTSRNRKKTAYHTFLSVWYNQFNELDYTERKHQLTTNGIFTLEQYEEHENSPLLYDEPTPTQTHRSRLASRHWAGLTPELRASWKDRADIINALPILGTFQVIPSKVDDSVILKALNVEYDKFVISMSRALMRPAHFLDSIARKSFGKDKRIQVRSKIFRSLYLNDMLKVVFFGRDFENVKKREVVYKTKRCVVMYIDSKERMEELFEINERNAFFARDRIDESKIYGCAGRVVLKLDDDHGLERKGYVMEEVDGDASKVRVYLEDNSGDIKINRPCFCNESGKWRFENGDGYEIVEYEPVRIKVLEGGNIHMLFHRICFKDNTNELLDM